MSNQDTTREAGESLSKRRDTGNRRCGWTLDRWRYPTTDGRTHARHAGSRCVGVQNTATATAGGSWVIVPSPKRRPEAKSNYTLRAGIPMPFPTNSSGDDFEKEIQEREGIYAQMLEKRCQSALDMTFDSHSGQPVESVKQELARQWQVATGGDEMVEPQLSAYAEAISAGRKIEIETP